jgi:hypothetical protein
MYFVSTSFVLCTKIHAVQLTKSAGISLVHNDCQYCVTGRRTREGFDLELCHLLSVAGIYIVLSPQIITLISNETSISHAQEY